MKLRLEIIRPRGIERERGTQKKKRETDYRIKKCREGERGIERDKERERERESD